MFEQWMCDVYTNDWYHGLCFPILLHENELTFSFHRVAFTVVVLFTNFKQKELKINYHLVSTADQCRTTRDEVTHFHRVNVHHSGVHWYWNELVLDTETFSGPLRLWRSTQNRKQSIAQPRAKRREKCLIIQYMYNIAHEQTQPNRVQSIPFQII